MGIYDESGRLIAPPQNVDIIVDDDPRESARIIVVPAS